MGYYLDKVQKWEKRNQRPNIIDGHQVQEVILESERMILFRDPEGKLWRRIHTWGMTWEVNSLNSLGLNSLNSLNS